jgi:hypothetical protein
MPATPPEFARIAKYLLSLGYRKRRQVLWHRVKPRLPRFLYKFRSLLPADEKSVDRMRDILVRSRLWFSSPEDFNDPFDTSIKAVVDGDPQELRNRIDNIFKARGMKWADRQREVARIMSRPQEIPLRVQETFKQTLYAMGVCSFGGDPRSILMWSHYAANHEGFCLQFELARDVENLISLEVNYSEEYPVLIYINGTDELMPLLLTKFKGWCYEKESRIIIPESARQYIDFRPAALSGIIIGCRAKQETVEALNNLLAERSARSYPMPKLYRVFLDNSNYELIIKRTDRPAA